MDSHDLVLDDMCYARTQPARDCVDSSDRDADVSSMRWLYDEQTSNWRLMLLTVKKYVGQVPGYGRTTVRASFAPVFAGMSESTPAWQLQRLSASYW
jgi:hypothetical protein